MRLDWDSEAVPQLHCPITKKMINPSITFDGVFVDGKRVGENGDFIVDFGAISTVMFYIVLGVSGELDYFRDDIQGKIDELREKLEDEDEDDDLSNIEILEEHVTDFGPTPLIFHIVLDGDFSSSSYIGLDLDISSAD